MWSKPISGSVLPNEKIPQNARVARGSGLRLFPSWMKSATLPNQARYQLRYTRIFNFCHYTTAGEKIKDFPVCGHLCGQSRFYAAFGNRGKSRKRRCHKALRRFALPRSGYRHGTPKAGALPTALHPVIQFFIRLGVFSQTNCGTLQVPVVIQRNISKKSHARRYGYNQ